VGGACLVEMAPFPSLIPPLHTADPCVFIVALLRLVTCMMIVTGLCFVNAAQEPREDVLPHCPQPGTRGRVVEHAHHARCPAWHETIRRVPEKSRHRAQHAHAAAQYP